MSPEKHTSYFNMLEALNTATGCPLCALEAKAVYSYLDSLLYESVNDPNVRTALRRSKGYCRSHAGKLIKFRDGLGTAMLYQDTVRDFWAFLDSVAGERKKISRAQSRLWLDHEGCPACRVRQEAGARYASILLGGLDQDEMRSAFGAGPGLCVLHLLFILGSGVEDNTRRYLVEVHQTKYGSLLRELEEFCRKHNYRRDGAGFGKEGDSWERAVKMIVGKDD